MVMETTMNENVRVEQETRTARIIFNKKFYAEKHIERAIADFSHLAHITQENDEIIFRGVIQEVNQFTIGYEFCNYLLGLHRQ